MSSTDPPLTRTNTTMVAKVDRLSSTSAHVRRFPPSDRVPHPATDDRRQSTVANTRCPDGNGPFTAPASFIESQLCVGPFAEDQPINRLHRPIPLFHFNSFSNRWSKYSFPRQKVKQSKSQKMTKCSNGIGLPNEDYYYY
jgi:hypothetical protein